MCEKVYFGQWKSCKITERKGADYFRILGEKVLTLLSVTRERESLYGDEILVP